VPIPHELHYYHDSIVAGLAFRWKPHFYKHWNQSTDHVLVICRYWSLWDIFGTWKDAWLPSSALTSPAIPA
jgi:hypothetical protein